MISLHPQEGKLRRADNLLPRADGSLYTRPGAVQVATGPVSAAVPWGNAVLMHRAGRLVLWAFGGLYDLGQQGRGLSAVPYQALTGDGLREDRLYFADGVGPLRYIRRTSGGGYEVVQVVNTVLDADGQPYPLPVPFALANWMNRLWLSDGTNRIYHSENEDPAQFDPLWVLEFQGDTVAKVRAMTAHNDVLLVGLDNTLWQVGGTSQYNWQVSQLLPFGVLGPLALASNGQAFGAICKQGIHWGNMTISEDLREAFAVADYGADLVVDTKRRLLWCYIGGRLFVTHMDAPGAFTEIAQRGIAGALALLDYAGWYGDDGVWLLGVINTGDQYLNHARRQVEVTYDTWETRPNRGGGGRALLSRLRLEVAGLPGTSAQYRVTTDSGNTWTTQFSLSDLQAALWTEVPYVAPELWPFTPAWRELAPRVAGSAFRHQVTSSDFIEIRAFLPDYRFGLPVPIGAKP